MLLYAIKMLIGDKAKYLGIIVGLSFSAFIITQQTAIFIGIMKRTYNFISDTSQADIWVMDPSVQYIDDIKGMKETALYRVRSVEGIDWAVPMSKGLIPTRLRNGIYQTCYLIGIDDPTLIGGPPKMLEGKITNLRFPDAVIIDKVGIDTKLAPLKVGDTLEINDNRCYVSGICEVSRTLLSQPVIYTTYGRATLFTPMQRDMLSFILVKAKPGVNVETLTKTITDYTGLAAYTDWGFKKLTMMYYVKNTGMVINFGFAVFLGIIIGFAIVGQTFYSFTVDNLPYFGIFKAMGASNTLLIQMIVLQALLVSAIGWGIGVGATALFGYGFKGTEVAFALPFTLYFCSGALVVLICLISAYFSIKKVTKLDPAIVFKS